MQKLPQAVLFAATFALGIGVTLAYNKAEPVVAEVIGSREPSSRPPIAIKPIRTTSIEQLKADNTCKTYERLGISTTAQYGK